MTIRINNALDLVKCKLFKLFLKILVIHVSIFSLHMKKLSLRESSYHVRGHTNHSVPESNSKDFFVEMLAVFYDAINFLCISEAQFLQV